MKLAGRNLNPILLNEKMKGEKPLNYTDLLSPHYKNIDDRKPLDSEQEIQNEVAAFTQECATCDDE
jgi:hypothetical protein